MRVKNVPGSFLSTKNTTKLTVYLSNEIVKGRKMLHQDNITEIEFHPTKQQQHPQCSASEKQL